MFFCRFTVIPGQISLFSRYYFFFFRMEKICHYYLKFNILLHTLQPQKELVKQSYQFKLKTFLVFYRFNTIALRLILSEYSTETIYLVYNQNYFDFIQVQLRIKQFNHGPIFDSKTILQINILWILILYNNYCWRKCINLFHYYKIILIIKFYFF